MRFPSIDLTHTPLCFLSKISKSRATVATATREHSRNFVKPIWYRRVVQNTLAGNTETQLSSVCATCPHTLVSVQGTLHAAFVLMILISVYLLKHHLRLKRKCLEDLLETVEQVYIHTITFNSNFNRSLRSYTNRIRS
jgi:hypothetical protein